MCQAGVVQTQLKGILTRFRLKMCPLKVRQMHSFQNANL